MGPRVEGGTSLYLAVADEVTEAAGGHGAVREVAERLLKAQGKWDAILSRYRS